MLLKNIDQLILEIIDFSKVTHTKKAIKIPKLSSYSGNISFPANDQIEELHKQYRDQYPKDYKIHGYTQGGDFILKHQDGSIHYQNKYANNEISKLASTEDEFNSKLKTPRYGYKKHLDKSFKEFLSPREINSDPSILKHSLHKQLEDFKIPTNYKNIEIKPTKHSHIALINHNDKTHSLWDYSNSGDSEYWNLQNSTNAKEIYNGIKPHHIPENINDFHLNGIHGTKEYMSEHQRLKGKIEKNVT
jgi:hypothetical protein